jgi:hypothetical protein
MTKYISFSLFGNNPFYCVGAVENIKLCPTIYPDWSPVVYVDDEVPTPVCKELRGYGAFVIEGSIHLSKNKKAWRFAAALIEDAEEVIFRDADSRINPREQACVNRWLESGKPLHIMRDHPFHANWLNAGMWGIEAKAGKKYISKILTMAKGIEVDEDQYLLARELYPYFRNQTIVHDSFFRREKWSEPFPTLRVDGQFVGERINEAGNPEIIMRDMLIEHERSRLLRFRLLVEDFKRIRTQQRVIP